MLYYFLQLMALSQLKMSPNPKHSADGKSDDPTYKSLETGKDYYGFHAKVATEKLMAFLNKLFPNENRLCVTYFDEAHELGLCFWILLRLLQAPDPSINMWYVFMGTKS